MVLILVLGLTAGLIVYKKVQGLRRYYLVAGIALITLAAVMYIYKMGIPFQCRANNIVEFIKYMKEGQF